MTNPREQLHHLVDSLSESQITALIVLLNSMLDPVATGLRDAPSDDEPESAEERQAVAQSRDWLARRGGKGIPHAEAMRRLGLE